MSEEQTTSPFGIADLARLNQEGERSMQIISHEPELTIMDRAKLVQIAHEAGPSDVRKWALDTLERASVPPIVFKAAP